MPKACSSTLCPTRGKTLAGSCLAVTRIFIWLRCSQNYQLIYNTILGLYSNAWHGKKTAIIRRLIRSRQPASALIGRQTTQRYCSDESFRSEAEERWCQPNGPRSFSFMAENALHVLVTFMKTMNPFFSAKNINSRFLIEELTLELGKILSGSVHFVLNVLFYYFRRFWDNENYNHDVFALADVKALLTFSVGAYRFERVHAYSSVQYSSDRGIGYFQWTLGHRRGLNTIFLPRI